MLISHTTLRNAQNKGRIRKSKTNKYFHTIKYGTFPSQTLMHLTWNSATDMSGVSKSVDIIKYEIQNTSLRNTSLPYSGSLWQYSKQRSRKILKLLANLPHKVWFTTVLHTQTRAFCTKSCIAPHFSATVAEGWHYLSATLRPVMGPLSTPQMTHK
jgi:hypothetical protein